MTEDPLANQAGPIVAGAMPIRNGRVLVVGAGFLGRHLVARLRTEGIDVTVLTRSTSGGPGSPPLDADVQRGDASNARLVEEALEGCTHVAWCAGGLLPADSNKDPARDVILSLPPLLTMLEALRARGGIGITLFSSGGTIYGNPEALPVRETHPARPLTSYGIMKLAAERYLDLYARLHGVPRLILRCGNVYGVGQQMIGVRGS